MCTKRHSFTMTTTTTGLLQRHLTMKLIPLLLLLVSLVQASPSNLTLRYYEEPTTTQLQKVTISPDGHNIIVGGRNVLLRVGPDMRKLQSLSTGPVQDGIACPPKFRTCANATLTPNDASVLIMNDTDPRVSLFLYCGTVHQGLCSVYSVKNLTDKEEMDASNTLNLLGNRESSVAFFGFGATINRNAPLRPALYVASTYDGRPLDYTPAAISTRKLEQNHVDQKYNISYMYINPKYDYATAKDFDPAYKTSFRVRYIYGFEHEGFSYFLTVQRRFLPNINNEYVTHLVRVCQGDIQYYSYTEIELNCKKAEYEPIFFNIAQAAYLGPVGGEMKRKSKYSDSEKVLYVAFGRNHSSGDGSGSDKAAPDYGSAVCMYSMTGIKADFRKAQVDCYSGRGSWPLWIKATDNHCKRDEQTSIAINDNFCGKRTNQAITARFPMDTVANVTTKDLVTSIKVITHNNKTIAVMGTHSGSVLKVIINGNNMPPYANISVSPSPVTDMALSRDHSHAYVLTANRVTEVPIQSCRVHTTCAACVTSGDPLGCGWCDSQTNNDKKVCSTEKECPDTWHNDSCPPIIRSFSPPNGTLEGGTIVTIVGENFGNPNGSLKLTVRMQRNEFEVLYSNWTHIVAKSRPSDMDTKAHLEVYVRDETHRPYTVEGDGYSHLPFHIFNASVSDFFPKIGPESGGTSLTIIGNNLNIGYSLTVQVDELPCPVQWKNVTSIVCLTSPWRSKFDRRKRSVPRVEVNVSVRIDNKPMGFDKKFTYAEDPVITMVKPRDSILSGGLRVTVSGQHLNSVRRPLLIAKVVGDGEREYFGECSVESNGETMYCLTPNISDSGVSISPLSPLSVDCSFHMDGVKNLRDFATTSNYALLSRFTYYVDPVFVPFKNNMTTFYLDDIMLDLNGRNLDFVKDIFKAYTVTVGNKPCNVTELGRRVLLCRPDKPDENADLSREYPVVVRVANLPFYMGKLQFAMPTQNATIIITILVFILLILVGLVVICIAWYMKRKRRGPWKIKNIHGERNVHYTGSHVQMGSTTERVYRMHPNNDERLASENSYWMHMTSPALPQPPETVIDDEARRLIDDAKLFISRDNLLLMEVIGQGHFGCVYRGFLKMEGTKQEDEVAVKTLKSLTVGANHFHSMADQSQSYTASVECRKFLEEALRMREFEHPNILRLIGIALDKEEMPLVVLPFMKHGDLLSYIRNETNSPTVKELMNFAIQIAEGMAYLANLKFVHRDLAARNCMLDDTMNVKVADFGLSRDIYERDYYSSDDPKAKLPVKWMAPESLEKGTYNTKTDVWSYGVVIWELMTRGVCPYPEVDNWDITKFLKEGRRMPQPSYCPDALYAIMLQCWDTEPKLRPVFQELVHNIRSIILSMERAHERVGLNITYVNVPTSQPYLYPQNNELGAVGVSSPYPSGIATISNGDPRNYPQMNMNGTGQRLSYHPVPGASANAGSRSTLV